MNPFIPLCSYGDEDSEGYVEILEELICYLVHIQGGTIDITLDQVHENVKLANRKIVASAEGTPEERVLRLKSATKQELMLLNKNVHWQEKTH